MVTKQAVNIWKDGTPRLDKEVIESALGKVLRSAGQADMFKITEQDNKDYIDSPKSTLDFSLYDTWLVTGVDLTLFETVDFELALEGRILADTGTKVSVVLTEDLVLD